MDRSAAVMLTALTGGLIAMQAPINGLLGRAVGSFQAALVSFVIGTIALAAIVGLARGGYGQIASVTSVPWYYLIGGLMGAIYVTTVLVTVGTLGAGGVTAATVTGQLAMSLVVDQLGWLGVQKSPITALKLCGVLLLGLGTYLIVRE